LIASVAIVVLNRLVRWLRARINQLQAEKAPVPGTSALQIYSTELTVIFRDITARLQLRQSIFQVSLVINGILLSLGLGLQKNEDFNEVLKSVGLRLSEIVLLSPVASVILEFMLIRHLWITALMYVYIATGLRASVLNALQQAREPVLPEGTLGWWVHYGESYEGKKSSWEHVLSLLDSNLPIALGGAGLLLYYWIVPRDELVKPLSLFVLSLFAIALLLVVIIEYKIHGMYCSIRTATAGDARRIPVLGRPGMRTKTKSRRVPDADDDQTVDQDSGGLG
jgi:hypothetical protein